MCGALVTLAATTGCIVPQPRGEGTLSRVVEPTTKRGYWLYLPKTYVEADDQGRRARRWPLVVSFHGMKPFDNARSQAREWEQEADRFGFITVAPELRAPDVLQQFPLRTVHPAFKSDELATVAILRHVFTNHYADPSNVLATSWSSGGYMAHYMLNRHPDLFTSLSVRQSNFSASVLDAAATARSRYHPILVVMTQNDFAGCKRESREAVEWYAAHRYVNAGWIEIKGLGHARTPDMAADFFGRVAGVRPSRPPAVLVRRQAINGNPEGLAFFSGKIPEFQSPPRAVAVRTPSVRALPETPLRRHAPAASLSGPAALAPTRVSRLPAARQAANQTPTPPRSRAPLRRRPVRSPLSIRASTTLGIEPLYLSFAALCPAEWQRSAAFLWTLNGDPLCEGVNGHKTLVQPGRHTLGLLVVTPNGKEYRASKDIRVVPRLETAKAARSGSDG